LLVVEGGKHYWLVVDGGGVEVDGGGGLGAEVAVVEVEVEGADVVGAAGAGELHASLDASDGVVSLHSSSVVFSRESDRHGGEAAKVMRGEFQSGNDASLRSADGSETRPDTSVDGANRKAGSSAPPSLSLRLRSE
jgi:hypothetical protein